MNKNYGFQTSQYYIRPSGNTRYMKPVSVALGMEKFSDCELERGILPPNAGHHPAASLPVDNVGHRSAR